MSLKLLRQKTLKGLIIFLFLFQQVKAQDFTIVYDLHKDSTSVYKFGKENDSVAVSEISFRKAGRIKLRVENFNPFYWNAKVTTFKRPVDEESGHIGMFVSSMTSSLGISGFPSLSRGSKGRTQEQLLKLYQKLEEDGIQLKDLKYNFQKSEAEIKSEAGKIGAEILSRLGKEKIDAREFRLIGKMLDDSLDAEMETPFSELLPLLAKTYNEIMNSSFRFSHSLKGDLEINEIKLQIYPRSDSVSKENPKDTITKYFLVRDKGILKLLNSVGITFTFFRDNNRSYYVGPDLKIGSGSADLFTPVMSTFIHFYGSKQSNFKIGGAFGFGFPLTGAKKEVNFMLGLCTALGRNESVLISAGVAGTKVQRLTNGWQVGQTVPSLSFNIPTVSQFRPGGFFTLSFNVKSLTGKKG